MRSWSPVSLKISSGWDCGFLWFDFLAFVSLITRISVHVFDVAYNERRGFDPNKFTKSLDRDYSRYRAAPLVTTTAIGSFERCGRLCMNTAGTDD